jgi:hypothetical protein
MRKSKKSRGYLGCIALTLLLAFVGQPCRAQDSADVAKVIVPFVQKHCLKCHGAEKPKAGLSLHTFTNEKAILRNASSGTRHFN